MPVTDQYVLNDTIYKLLENGKTNAAFPSLLTAMFTATQLLDTLNRVQNDFLLATGLIVTQDSLNPSVGSNIAALPATTIRPRRLTWTDASDDITRVLTEVDTWELDNDNAGWQQSWAIPIAWYENQLQQQQIAIAPPPVNNGTLGLLLIELATVLTGSGAFFTIPDDWTPYIMYGALAELLGADGPAYDPARADYCQRRYSEGIELARLILGGE